MRVDCQSCDRVSDLGGLVPVPGGFGYTCACGHVNVLAPVVAPRAEPAAEGPEDEPAVTCPKCGHRQDDARACHRCGLVFAKAVAGRFDDDALGDHPLADSLRARWAELRTNLDDQAGHKAFIRTCAEANLMEFAGLCYRRLGGREDPRVTAYRDQVIAAALARVGAIETRATEVMTSRLRTLLVLGVAAFIVMGLAIGYYLLAKTSTTAQF